MSLDSYFITKGFIDKLDAKAPLLKGSKYLLFVKTPSG